MGTFLPRGFSTIFDLAAPRGVFPTVVHGGIGGRRRRRRRVYAARAWFPRRACQSVSRSWASVGFRLSARRRPFVVRRSRRIREKRIFVQNRQTHVHTSS